MSCLSVRSLSRWILNEDTNAMTLTQTEFSPQRSPQRPQWVHSIATKTNQVLSLLFFSHSPHVQTLKYAQKYCREAVFTVMCTFCKTLPLDTATALKPSVLTHSKQHDGKTLGLPVREKKKEEKNFSTLAWILLERLRDMDPRRLGPHFQLSRAPRDALACQIDLIHANVSLQPIQQHCITMQ